MRGESEKVREAVLALIDSEAESDAAFEREMGLPEKTVSNWRRRRSSSFMTILPQLSQKFEVSISELIGLAVDSNFSLLSEDEAELLTLYRRSHVLPKRMRRALKETIEATVSMYLAAAPEKKKSDKKS